MDVLLTWSEKPMRLYGMDIVDGETLPYVNIVIFIQTLCADKGVIATK